MILKAASNGLLALTVYPINYAVSEKPDLNKPRKLIIAYSQIQKIVPHPGEDEGIDIYVLEHANPLFVKQKFEEVWDALSDSKKEPVEEVKISRKGILR